MSSPQLPTTSASAPLLITSGEPSGIGMDIVLDTLVHRRATLRSPVLICADVDALRARAKALYQAVGLDCQALLDTATVISIKQALGGDIAVTDIGKIGIIHTPCAEAVIAGKPDARNAKMVGTQLELAHALAERGTVRAIVTAPLHKAVMIEGGVHLDNGEQFSGHTEYFMHKAGCQKVVMMLANSVMKVALVTTHLPLKDVATAITDQAVRDAVHITLASLRKQFGITRPRVLVCGLNPHAGEDGHLGQEELTIINPVLKALQEQGHDVSLSMPADTLFTKKYLNDCDAIIAMYHDQGLPVLKSHGFGDTVNITLGLPYVRTSVDHGTALDLAGTGQAISSSLVQAITLAYQMSDG